jgi:hypothetical protein
MCCYRGDLAEAIVVDGSGTIPKQSSHLVNEWLGAHLVADIAGLSQNARLDIGRHYSWVGKLHTSGAYKDNRRGRPMDKVIKTKRTWYHGLSKVADGVKSMREATGSIVWGRPMRKEQPLLARFRVNASHHAHRLIMLVIFPEANRIFEFRRLCAGFSSLLE